MISVSEILTDFGCEMTRIMNSHPRVCKSFDRVLSHGYYNEIDQRHNTYGPALIEFDEEGNVIYEMFCLNGVSYAVEEWLLLATLSLEEKAVLKMAFT